MKYSKFALARNQKYQDTTVLYYTIPYHTMLFCDVLAACAPLYGRSTHREEAAPHSRNTHRRGSGFYDGKGGPITGVNDGSGGGGGGSSVFDRLVAAGKEAERRKFMLGNMPPPGCTFRPQARHAGAPRT